MRIRWKIITLFTLLLLLAVSASGSVSSLTISPDNPVVGDEITIKGIANQGEVLHPSITFNETAAVSKGSNEYNYLINGIEVPTKKNTFVIAAKHVKNLKVKVEKWGLSWTFGTEATAGNATISKANVPGWTYNIKIFGTADSGVSSVPLTITGLTTSSDIKADNDGNFEYEFSTSKLPPDTYLLSIGGMTKEITLLPKNYKSGGEAKEVKKTEANDNEILTHAKGTSTASVTPDIKETISEIKETPVVTPMKDTPTPVPTVTQRELSTLIERLLSMLKLWN